MTETKRKKYRRLILKRSDGETYLNRWGFGFKKFITIMIHRMDAPDPGVDLHDHPWWFVTIPLWGGYVEERANNLTAAGHAKHANWFEAQFQQLEGRSHRGIEEVRKPFRPRVMRLDECHTITKLRKKHSWSLVISGPVVQPWGFFLSDGWVEHKKYENTDAGLRRGLFSIKPTEDK